MVVVVVMGGGEGRGGGGERGCLCEDAACARGRLNGHENRSSHGQRKGACRAASEIVAERERACGDEAEPVRRIGLPMDRSMEAHIGREARRGKGRRLSATLVFSPLRRRSY